MELKSRAEMYPSRRLEDQVQLLQTFRVSDPQGQQSRLDQVCFTSYHAMWFSPCVFFAADFPAEREKGKERERESKREREQERERERESESEREGGGERESQELCLSEILEPRLCKNGRGAACTFLL